MLSKHKKKNKEKHYKKSKERRKSSTSYSVDEGNSHERNKRHNKKKKKHKKKSKRHKSNERSEKHSPTVITIDSDTDSYANDSVAQTNSTYKDNPTDNTTEDPVDPLTLDSVV